MTQRHGVTEYFYLCISVSLCFIIKECGIFLYISINIVIFAPFFNALNEIDERICNI